MIKIGICDDNATLLRKYSLMIEEICKDKQIEISMSTYSDGREVINEYENNKDTLDILFLDVLMNELNGVETARTLRRLKSKVIIIFLTSSEEYIFETMDVKALAYVMKDQVNKESVDKLLMNAVARVDKQRSESIYFEKDNGAYSLAYGDICFIKVYKGFGYIHHWDGIIFESANLSLIEKLSSNFFKVHQQYIINLQYVGKIEKESVILSDESKNVIPLDKHYAKELKLRFAQYMMEKM